MHLRAFVLKPLLELAPGIALPGLGPAARWLAATREQRIEPWPAG
jgi:2-amino-4-hydroxy-6-hydroxymethyldihydropteridine diphosphokinase